MPGEGRRLLLWDFTADAGAEMQNIDVNKETMGEMYHFSLIVFVSSHL